MPMDKRTKSIPFHQQTLVYLKFFLEVLSSKPHRQGQWKGPVHPHLGTNWRTFQEHSKRDKLFDINYSPGTRHSLTQRYIDRASIVAQYLKCWHAIWAPVLCQFSVNAPSREQWMVATAQALGTHMRDLDGVLGLQVLPGSDVVVSTIWEMNQKMEHPSHSFCGYKFQINKYQQNGWLSPDMLTSFSLTLAIARSAMGS